MECKKPCKKPTKKYKPKSIKRKSPVNTLFTGLKKWCRETELNCRHADFQSAALPTELSRQPKLNFNILSVVIIQTSFLKVNE